jgi:hypothetical protein
MLKECGTVSNPTDAAKSSRTARRTASLDQLGGGHVLAAAGREVTAIETSDAHRSFISRKWGIDTVHASFDEIPAGKKFAAVRFMNTIEHIFDVAGFLSEISAYMSCGSAMYLSTCNAAASPAKICGVWWSMFKPLDHVSLASPPGLMAVAERCRFSCRAWTKELPFETAISLAGAARGWLRSEKTADEGKQHPGKGEWRGKNDWLRQLVVDGSKKLRWLDPVRPGVSALGFGCSVKAVFRPN